MEKCEIPTELIEILKHANNESLKSIREKAISLTDAQTCSEHIQLIPSYPSLKAR
jgi:hypothetical protein